LQLRAELPNAKFALIPGLYGKVLAEYGELRKSVLIPARTVQTDQQGDYIFVMDDNKKVERRAIKTGQRFDTLIEIVQGLKDTETFVLNGFINISTGQTVNPEMATVAPLPAR
jgi:multidrug efflux pump subunit AcrA (membrane-fusion protein)